VRYISGVHEYSTYSVHNRREQRDHQGSQSQTACSFRWFIVLKALFAGLLWEKNTAGWLLILLISPNERGERVVTFCYFRCSAGTVQGVCVRS
jgi:hypothetical protein